MWANHNNNNEKVSLNSVLCHPASPESILAEDMHPDDRESKKKTKKPSCQEPVGCDLQAPTVSAVVDVRFVGWVSVLQSCCSTSLPLCWASDFDTNSGSRLGERAVLPVWVTAAASRGGDPDKWHKGRQTESPRRTRNHRGRGLIVCATVGFSRLHPRPPSSAQMIC